MSKRYRLVKRKEDDMYMDFGGRTGRDWVSQKIKRKGGLKACWYRRSLPMWE